MEFDVIIIGGGHAGIEAAYAAAKMGVQVGMFTLNPKRIGFMSCNPAIGGLAKGQLVKEIDALGGLMGINSDLAGIQFRQLNQSKGPAVRSSRAQCDKNQYSKNMQLQMSQAQNLKVIEEEVNAVLVNKDRVTGVMTQSGASISTKCVVITSGTFLKAMMHVGESQTEGGRAGDPSSKGLSECLSNLGFRLRRLKTGTPPRLHKETIDWSKTKQQPGDKTPKAFSFYRSPSPFPVLKQISCHITYTNERTHEIIENAFDRSPIFTGQIVGTGPRYCPSIEDKISRFRDKSRHQIFLEPEGLDVDEVYVNGVSTSLPADVQENFIHSIVGLEKARFLCHGYAVEYDAVDSRQLKRTFESKEIEGLFTAGQINGTSGYEEAGAQGLIAGINAASRVLGKDDFVLDRSDAYIGVLADDLTLTGSDEPYRMFTSRAEYRLLLREDNADLRLMPKARELGLISDEIWRKFIQKRESITQLRNELDAFHMFPVEQSQKFFLKKNLPKILDRISGSELLKRPEIRIADFNGLGVKLNAFPKAVLEQAEIQIKYKGYIERDLQRLKGVQKNERLKIPKKLDFSTVFGLSNEVIARLSSTRPETIGQLSRIQGITPAAVANLLIHLKMKSGTTAFKSKKALRKEKLTKMLANKNKIKIQRSHDANSP